MLVHQKFMEIYRVTAVLVLAEYFENPYYYKQFRTNCLKDG